MSLSDLPVALSNDIEDFSGDIALQTADGLKLGMSLADSFVDIDFRARIRSQSSDGDDMQRTIGSAVPTSIEPMSGYLA